MPEITHRLRSAFEEKYVIYDIRDLRDSRYRKYEPERYKQTSTSGGPLSLWGYDAIAARVMWENEHPMQIPFSLTSLYCFLVCGDGPPPAFSLGFVPIDDLNPDMAQWDTEFNFIDTLFLTHGWKIVDIWHQSDSLYLDIQLDLSAIDAVDGWVEQYTHNATHRGRREPNLYGRISSQNTFVLALTFRNAAPSLPYNWTVADSAGQQVPEVSGRQRIADAQRRSDYHRSTLRSLHTTERVPSGHAIHHQRYLALSLPATQPESCVNLAQTEEQDSAGEEEGSILDALLADFESYMDVTDEEQAAASLAQSALRGGVHPSDEALVPDAGNPHSGQNTPHFSHSDDGAQRQMHASRRHPNKRCSRLFPTDYITGSSEGGGAMSALSSGYGAGRGGCQTADLCHPSAPNITGTPKFTLHVQLTESDMAENGDSISDSDSYRRPRHKQKDLADFLGVTQKPLKPKASQTPSSSESISKESRRMPNFLAGIFKGDDAPSSSSSISTDGTNNSQRRRHKHQVSSGNATGSLSGASAFSRNINARRSSDMPPGPVVVMESPNVGLDRNSYDIVIKESVGNGGNTLKGQSVRAGTPPPTAAKTDIVPLNNVTATGTDYVSNARMTNTHSKRSSPATSSRNVAPNAAISHANSPGAGTPIVKSPLLNMDRGNTPTASNTSTVSPAVNISRNTASQPFAAHLMAARARVFALWDQADDDYEASVANEDDREVARKADEEKARAMKNRYKRA